MTEIACVIIDAVPVKKMIFLWTHSCARIYTGRRTGMAVNKKRNRFEIIVFRCVYCGVKHVDRVILQFQEFAQHYAHNRSKRMAAAYVDGDREPVGIRGYSIFLYSFFT